MTLISIRRKFGNAVKRNKARRRIRDICSQSGWLNASGHLMLITVSDRATSSTYQQFKADLDRAFSALNASSNENI